MKRFSTLFRQELLVALRSGFLIFLSAIFVVLVVVYHLLPDEIELGPSVVFLDEAGLSRDLRLDEGARLVASREELEEAVRDGDLGIVARRSPDAGDPSMGITLELVVGPGLGTRSANLVRAGLEYALAEQMPGAMPSFETVLLEPQQAAMTIPQIYLPMMAMFEVAILGFLFIAVMVFQERQDGAIRAYRVSPGGTVAYTLAKIAAWAFLSLVYGFLFAFTTLFFSIGIGAWLQYLLIVLLVSVFMSAFGLVVATFFRSISEWFFIGLVLLVVNMLPQLSFANPSFSPDWIRYIPSYPALFAIRDVLYGWGDGTGVGGAVGLYLVLAAGSVLLAIVAVHFRLMKNPKA